MEKFKTNLHKFLGGIYIPHALTNRKNEIIMHISDTPVTFYSPLKTLIKKLEPEYIIHTGDLVDNIKLEFSKNLSTRYEKSVKTLLDILESSNAKKVYVSLGNHDNYDIVRKYTNKISTFNKSTSFYIKNIHITASHIYNEIDTYAYYNFFGHDLTLKTCEKDNKFFFNGIMGINIIVINTDEIYTLPYPFGTDDMRLKKGRMGF